MNVRENEKDYKNFESLTFEDFKRLAKNEKLSRYEKIGFPDEYRKGYERAIFDDIKSKLKGLREKSRIVLDIGCGCSELAFMILDLCERNNSKLLLVDSEEMLSMIPTKSFVEKFPGRFPDCSSLFEKYKGNVDVILVYSVIQHVFLESNIFVFIDKACELLRDGGEMLIGDIPNVSKRKRFFSSKSGIQCHQRFTGKNELPKVEFMAIEEKKIDDGVVFGILQRYRNFGFDTYLLPQNEKLPIATRREDILIKKP
ncbi:MAG: class I SAM-dependent methyltransferase [Candidatus Bathyarchaeota archaeon]|nr:class I SAM-dependent methyltransferase [Candidatus Bathyarchaeota archaeon]